MCTQMHTFAHAHAHALTLTLSRSLAHSLTCARSLSFVRTLSLLCVRAPSLSNTRAHTLGCHYCGGARVKSVGSHDDVHLRAVILAVITYGPCTQRSTSTYGHTRARTRTHKLTPIHKVLPWETPLVGNTARPEYRAGAARTGRERACEWSRRARNWCEVLPCTPRRGRGTWGRCGSPSAATT